MRTTQMVLRINQLQDLTISTCLHMYILYLSLINNRPLIIFHNIDQQKLQGHRCATEMTRFR